jgi:hypothetical protein
MFTNIEYYHLNYTMNWLHINCSLLWIMKRDHVLTTSLNPESDSYDRSFVLRLVRKDRIFFTHSIRSMLVTLNWMRSYSYRREMNRHWSVSIHLDTDQKIIKNNLRRTSFGWWSTLCWVSIDHFYSWWNQRSSFAIFLIFDSDFYLYQSTFAALQLESEFDQQTIYSFETRSIKFVSFRSQSNPDLASHQTLATPHISQAQVVKLLQWRQTLNHS